MAENEDLHPFWREWALNTQAMDQLIERVFPDGVEVGGVPISTYMMQQSTRYAPGTYLAAALAAALNANTPLDPGPAWRAFLGTLGAGLANIKERRGGGGDFPRDLVSDALSGVNLLEGANVAQIIVPNVYRLSVRATVGTQDVVNVLHFLGAGPGLEQDLVEDFKTNFYGLTLPAGIIGNTSVMWRDVTAVDLSTIDGGIYLDSTSFGVATTAQLATAGAAALIQWNGGTRNRNARGRTYYGPLRESHIDTDGRTLATATRTAFENAWETFRTAMITAGWTLGVLSRQTSTFYPVTRMTIAPIIATQRRRIRS